MDAKTYLVSACLLGLCTRYDGGHNRNIGVLNFCSGHFCIPVCPEQLGGLPTPRAASEIVNGEGADVLDLKCVVVDRSGSDVSSAFRLGAEQTLYLARQFEAVGAILKSRSPSCGTGLIHDGTFRGRYRAGDGVTAALLKRHGFQVLSELDLPG
jgi:uncharacterized protein YbbK (DUF523 family)